MPLALKMDTSLPSGITVPDTHWILLMFEIAPLAYRADISLGGYINLAAPQNNLQPVATRRYEVTGEEFADLFAQTIEAAGGDSGEPFQIALNRIVFNYVRAKQDVVVAGVPTSFFADAVEVS